MAIGIKPLLLGCLPPTFWHFPSKVANRFKEEDRCIPFRALAEDVNQSDQFLRAASSVYTVVDDIEVYRFGFSPKKF